MNRSMAAIVGAFGVAVACAAFGSVAPAERISPGPLMLDDVPEPLPRTRPAGEADRDRLEAAALFAAGRTHQHREAHADALRCYQRALRLDPKSSTIARAIIPVAIHLKHYDVAVRYALKVVALEDSDPMLLRRLGGYLAEEGDWTRALSLYEKAVAARGQDQQTSVDLLLRMEMGRLYCLTEQYAKAADCFAAVLRAIESKDPPAVDPSLAKVLLGQPGPTYQLIGECFLAADRPREALAAFEKANQASPDKALHQFNLARVHAKTDRPVEALAALEACFAEGLTDQGQTPYALLAEVLERLGKSGELIERLEKLRAAQPQSAPLGYYLASRHQAAGRLDRAEALCLELLRAKPTPAGYRSLMEIDRQAKRFDVLLGALGEALDKFSVLDLLGVESQLLSGDPESMHGIVETAREMLKTSPERFGTSQRLAVALLALEAKQYETASEFFELALGQSSPAQDAERPRTAEALMAWGVGLLLGDRPAEAARVFQRGIDQKLLPDDNPSFQFYLSGALAVAGRTDEALAAAGAAAEKRPDSARFRGRAAWGLYFAKRYDEAQKAYRQLIDAFDADRDASETRQVLREARLALSNLCVISGEMDAAEEWLEQVLDEFPDDPSASNDLGYLWADRNKNLHRALRLTRGAVEADPQSAAYRDSLGWALFRLGRYDEALVELEKAAAGEKPDGVVLDHLGDAYDKLGRRGEALAAWRRAAEALRNEKDVVKAAEVEKKLKIEN